MEPRIVLLNEKKLLGISLKMNLLQNKTFELWSKFMPRKKEIENSISSQLYSMQVYDKSLNFSNFTPETIFEKWATVEVLDFSKIPEGMQPYTLKGGLYVVFDYKGAASEFQSTFQLFLTNGFRHLFTGLTIASILRFLAINIKTTIPTQKRKFGYR